MATYRTDSASDEELIRTTLAEYGRLTRGHMSKYLPETEAGDYLGELVADYPKRGGKMLRPALCLATACAFGAELDDALGCAVSIELMHNALLIHDDIEDDSERRRGKPTLHALHGIPLALNAGDALALLSLRPLNDNAERLGEATARRLQSETQRMAWETAEGQAMELGWRRDNCFDLEDADYLTMVLKKTCWLTTIHPMRVGCIVAGGSKSDVESIFRFAFFFGAAFQIQDDLLNLDSDLDHGKEPYGDLLEGKRTLMLLHVMRRASDSERRRLRRFLALPRAERDEDDLHWLNRLMLDGGAIDHARSIAEALAGAALYEFGQVFDGVPDSDDKRFLRALVTWVLRRVH